MDPKVVAELVRTRRALNAATEHSADGNERYASYDSGDDQDAEGTEDSEADDEDNEEELDPDGDAANPSRRGNAGDALDGEPCQGLLDTQMDPSPAEALARAHRTYGVNLLAVMDKAELDFFARIRLVNYIRSRVMAGDSPQQASAAADAAVLAGANVGVLADDAFLKPVIPGDVLLTILDSAEDDDAEDVASAVAHGLELTERQRDAH
jgi:hypothetical protein